MPLFFEAGCTAINFGKEIHHALNISWQQYGGFSHNFQMGFPCTSGLPFKDATGLHIGMDRNFVCLWRRHNCRSQVIDLSLSAQISLFLISIIGFLNNYNFYIINNKNLFCCIRKNL
jgi:hypothetical protein